MIVNANSNSRSPGKVNKISNWHGSLAAWLSDSQVEAATGESLDRGSDLVDDLWLKSLLSLSLHLLSSLLLVVLSLHVLKLSG